MPSHSHRTTEEVSEQSVPGQRHSQQRAVVSNSQRQQQVQSESSAPGNTQAVGGTDYTIRRGDTLWKIAKRVYGSGRYWNDIYINNTSVCKNNGNLILVGDVLRLPSIQIPSQQQSSGPEISGEDYGVCEAIEPYIQIEAYGSFYVYPNEVADNQLIPGPNRETPIREGDIYTLEITWQQELQENTETRQSCGVCCDLYR